MNVHHRRHSSLVSRTATERRITNIRRDVKVIRACILFLVIIVGITASVLAADILAPTAIAIVLALVLAPVARALQRWGLHEGVATVFAVVFTVAVLAGIGAGLAPAVNAWVGRLPQIAADIERKIQPIMQKIATFESATNAGTEGAVAPAPAPSAPMGGLVFSAVRTAPAVIAKIAYVTALAIFLLALRRRYTEQLILMPARFENRLRMSRICRDVRFKVSGYLFTLASINICLVAITSGLFYAFHIPDPLLWGTFLGLFNFIPVIGPAMVILTAVVISFGTGDTLVEWVLPPLILLCIHAVESNIVQPWLLSRRIVVNPLAIFIMVVLLVWMWGPAAAITAVPMLIIFHTVSLHVPSLRPVALLLARDTDHGDGTHGLGLRARRQQMRAARTKHPSDEA